MKYITQYPKQSDWEKDVEAGVLAVPNVTWALDTDTIHFYRKSKIIYYGTIPSSIIITNLTDLTATQLRYYLQTVDYNSEEAKELSVTGLEGDKLVVLVPTWTGMTGVGKDNGFGDKVEFCTDILGSNGDQTVTLGSTEFKIYGEVITVSGYYTIKTV